MNNIIDLNQEREINELIDKLGSLMSNDKTMTDRTMSVVNGSLKMKSDGNVLLSVRVPKELMDWIDSYTRIAAVNTESRITRTDTVVGFLEAMKALIAFREKTEWGKSHQDVIKEVLESASSFDETAFLLREPNGTILRQRIDNIRQGHVIEKELLPDED